MDTRAIARVAKLAEGIVADIRKYNDSRYKQRIDSELLTIEVKVQEAAEVKASELLREKIQHSQQLLQLERQRAKVQRERVDNLKKFLFSAGVQLSGTPVALTIMLVCGIVGCGLGVYIGLNILPSAVACKSVDSLCYRWRNDPATTIAPEKSVFNKQMILLKKKTKKRF